MSSLVHYVRSSIGEDWSQYQDPSTNNTYWHNSKTDEFFWSNLEPRQRSSADHWWEQYEDPQNAQPYWVNTTTSEYFHVGQQSSSGPHSVATLAHQCDMTVAEDTGAGSADEMPVIVLPWQPPSYPWRSRRLNEIIHCCTDDMKWKALKNFSMCSTALDPALSDLPWSLIMQQVVQMAALEVRSLPFSATEQLTWSLTMWQETVQKAHLDTIKGLQQFLLQWKRDDSVVEAWLDGTLTCSPSTADIGGWLADYMHSLFTVLTEQGKPNMKYVVVPNKDYKSLCLLLDVGSHHAGAVCDRNPEKLGNILEQLCWHAYEHRQGAFILAIIWNTVNRCLASGSVTDEFGAATEHTEVCVSGVHTPAVPLRTISHKQAKDKVIRALYERMIEDEEDLRQHVDLPWREAIANEVTRWAPRYKRCTAKLFTDEADPNYSDKPRLDLVFYYADDSWIRWHPGAECIYSHQPISDAVQARRNRLANLQHAQNS